VSQPIGQPELLKEINRLRTFEILKSERVVSRPSLVERTGLSRATVAVLVDELLEAGLVREVGLGNSTGGRPPVLLQFDPDAAYAIGARMSGHTWTVVATNLDAEIVYRHETYAVRDTPEAAIEALSLGVTVVCDHVAGKRLLPAIGLGTPGLVDVRSGVIETAVDVGWFRVPFAEMAERALGRRVYVANRSKVGALAELWCAQDEAVDDLVYISISTGVAAGIVHDGALLIGTNSSAGELGHVTVLPDGPLCPCGNRGCLQQLVSGPAMANAARARLRREGSPRLEEMSGHHPERITGQMVIAAAEAGDALSLDVVAQAARYLGIAVANLINLFNPQRIVLGGPIGRAGGVLLEPLRAEVQRRAMAYPRSAVEIATSGLGPDTSAIGAAVLVLQHSSELFFLEGAG
jgi:predicted NBD/HSP70 family sugar kinase